MQDSRTGAENGATPARRARSIVSSHAPPGRCARARPLAVRARSASTRCGGGPPPESPTRTSSRANEADAEAVKWQLQRRLASLEDDAAVAVLRPHRRERRRPLVHRAAPRRGRRRRAGRRRLAGRGRDAVLPGDARRPVRPAPAPPVRVHRRASSATSSTRTSTIPTRSPARAACPTRCSPSSAGPAPGRCATSSRRSRPSRTRSSARRSNAASSCRAVRARARPRSGCTAPRSCSTSTATCLSREGVLVVGPNPVFLRYICAGAAVARRDVGDADDRRRAALAALPCASPRIPAPVAAVKGDARMATRDRARPRTRDQRARRRLDARATARAASHLAARRAAGARRRRAAAGVRRSTQRASGSGERCCARAYDAVHRRRLRSSSTRASSAPSCSPGPRTARRSTAAGARVNAVGLVRSLLTQKAALARAADGICSTPTSKRALLRPRARRRRVDRRRPPAARRGRSAGEGRAPPVRPRRRRRSAGPLAHAAAHARAPARGITR